LLGGAGHNLYVGDRKKLTSAIDWYQGISRRLKAPSLQIRAAMLTNSLLVAKLEIPRSAHAPCS
jgi:hypothetical protein